MLLRRVRRVWGRGAPIVAFVALMASAGAQPGLALNAALSVGCPLATPGTPCVSWRAVPGPTGSLRALSEPV